MDVVLLDTSVASLLHPKKKDSLLSARYKAYLKGKVLALSFQSVAELLSWPEFNQWGVREQERFELFLHKFLVISYSFELAKVWAKVSMQCQKQGRRLESGDAWIAATAVHRKIPLVTHDRDHVGLNISRLQIVSYVENNQNIE